MPGSIPAKLGEYLILMPLARGEHSRVFVARPAPGASTRRPVALKQLARPLSELDLKRAKLLAAFESPHFARIIEANDQGFIALQLLNGWSLRELIAGRDRPFGLTDAIRIVGSILSGLVSLQVLRDPLASEQTLVHRGIAPRKVIVGSDGQTRLLGFERAGSAEGSPGYAAPEQVVGGVVGPAADVWSVASLLVELLTGTPYLPRGSVQEMRLASIDPPPFDARRLPLDAPPRLGALLRVALDPEPAQRLPSARDFFDALSAIAPDLTEPIADPAAMAGDALWLQREKSATRIARAETMLPFHLDDDSFERWEGGSAGLTPTHVNVELQERSFITDPGEPQTIITEPGKQQSITQPARPPPHQEAVRPQGMSEPGSSQAKTEPNEPAEPDTKPVIALLRQQRRVPERDISVRALPKSGSLPLILTALLALGVITAIGGGYWFKPKVNQIQPLVQPPFPSATRAPDQPRAEVSPPVVAPAAEALKPPPPVKTKRIATPPAPVAPKPPPPPVAEAKPPDDGQERVRSLMNRARLLKKKDGVDAASIDRLLGRLVVEASARDREQRDARLADIERELASLEQ